MGWIAENLQKPEENKGFSVFWGAWKGAVIRKSGTGAVLVDLVAHFWRPARDSLKVSVQVGAKMGARWPKLGSSWQQVASKMGHDSGKLAILGSTWKFFGSMVGAFWDYFGTWAG